MTIWFPEPETADDSWARRGEQRRDWLARSTLPRARAARRFLNENISRLPDDAQCGMYNALRDRYKSAFFELIVARTLQALGATIQVEPAQHDKKHPDFRAEFPDATIIVEAVSPNFDAAIDDELVRQNTLVDIVDKHVPDGWSAAISELPNIGPADSKRAFKERVKTMLSIPPPADNTTVLNLIDKLPTGNIRLRLIPRRPQCPAIVMQTSSAHPSDFKKMICDRLRKKRKQVRGTSFPVLLAVEHQWSDALDDFDEALYGHTCDVINTSGQEESTFKADGLFSRRSGKPPTFAGILAFCDVGFRSVSRLALYHHPRFEGHLPEALAMIEQRRYERTLGVHSITALASSLSALLEPLGFVKE